MTELGAEPRFSNANPVGLGIATDTGVVGVANNRQIEAGLSKVFLLRLNVHRANPRVNRQLPPPIRPQRHGLFPFQVLPAQAKEDFLNGNDAKVVC